MLLFLEKVTCITNTGTLGVYSKYTYNQKYKVLMFSYELSKYSKILYMYPHFHKDIHVYNILASSSP